MNNGAARTGLTTPMRRKEKPEIRPGVPKVGFAAGVEASRGTRPLPRTHGGSRPPSPAGGAAAGLSLQRPAPSAPRSPPPPSPQAPPPRPSVACGRTSTNLSCPPLACSVGRTEKRLRSAARGVPASRAGHFPHRPRLLPVSPRPRRASRASLAFRASQAGAARRGGALGEPRPRAGPSARPRCPAPPTCSRDLGGTRTLPECALVQGLVRAVQG
ncbi:uncharacterized protein [Castor canadensis]|uniref:Uncharacterized protein n=1 Tax=Castor canadensis TaxID=51338 RepID=A0AC58N222_CASCN